MASGAGRRGEILLLPLQQHHQCGAGPWRRDDDPGTVQGAGAGVPTDADQAGGCGIRPCRESGSSRGCDAGTGS